MRIVNIEFLAVTRPCDCASLHETSRLHSPDIWSVFCEFVSLDDQTWHIITNNINWSKTLSNHKQDNKWRRICSFLLTVFWPLNSKYIKHEKEPSPQQLFDFNHSVGRVPHPALPGCHTNNLQNKRKCRAERQSREDRTVELFFHTSETIFNQQSVYDEEWSNIGYVSRKHDGKTCSSSL